MVRSRSVLFVVPIVLCVAFCAPRAVAGVKPRVIVSTDIGGSDPDDFQSMVHYLVYADRFDTEGLISSPPRQGRAQDILECLAAYEKDHANLRSWSSEYPTPEALRANVRQGLIDPQVDEVPAGRISDGAKLIIERAHADDPRPIYVLVWGSLTDVAQAVHKAPAIKTRLRIYSIGSWNTREDPKARNYLYDNHPDLWWIESDTTFRGVYMGGDHSGDLNNRRFPEEHVKGHGHLGDLFMAKKPDIKMSDTASVLYLLHGDPDQPETASWGGAFVRPDPGRRPTYWYDDPSEKHQDHDRNGSRTINQWRQDYLRDWQDRMNRVRNSRTQSQRRSFTNSLGMKMVSLDSGSFMMGGEEAYKEKPVHRVSITKPFYLSATQVTNAQYEQYDHDHRTLRGKYGLSKEDNEAVVFVSWHDATAFCRWLSNREGVTYRLPTEAEWEYAARAGTTTRYHTGESLPGEYHRNQQSGIGVTAVPLHVGTTPPNAWGLYDMHGLVEEWVYDWYGPYTAEEKTDPVGRKDGTVKVTRGGSHGTPVEFLRSATRLGTLPEDRSWLIGLRVVQADLPDTEPLPPEEPRKWARDVRQKPHRWSSRTAVPFFAVPQSFVNIPRGSAGPVYCRFADLDFQTNHVNHCPAVTWLDNGDLFAVWYSTTGTGRDMTTAASRYQADSDEWTEADVFFSAPGRNQTGSSLFKDRDGNVYWFNGLSAAQGHQMNNALIMSRSSDHGVIWSHPTLINPERNDPQRTSVPVDNVNPDTTILEDGRVIIYSDNNTGRLRGGSTALMFIDLDKGSVEFSKGQIGGIHATAVALKDGRMRAIGRTAGDTDIWDASSLPMSISHDGGNTWEYSSSEFPLIGHGQRSVLMRLQEGPLLLVSFSDPGRGGDGMFFKDRNGGTFRGYGMFGAVSLDEGETWPIKKLITPADGKAYEGQGATRDFTATHTQAEHRGYLTATQTPDGVIHLLTSGLHYRFNLAWLKELNPTPAADE